MRPHDLQQAHIKTVLEPSPSNTFRTQLRNTISPSPLKLMRCHNVVHSRTRVIRSARPRVARRDVVVTCSIVCSVSTVSCRPYSTTHASLSGGEYKCGFIYCAATTEPLLHFVSTPSSNFQYFTQRR